MCWEALRQPPVDPEEANRVIVPDRRRVRRARAGDVLMMKGALGSSRRGGQVHRSPPIEHAGLARVVLVITALE